MNIKKSTLYEMVTLPSDGVCESGLDTFILASGSDRRAYRILELCKDHFARSCQFIVLNFAERVQNKPDSDALYDFRRLNLPHLRETSCEIKNPSSILKEFLSLGLGSSRNVGVDVSCFTKPYFFFLLKLLRERLKLSRTSVYYTEPQQYLFKKGLFSTFHSTSGPLAVNELQGFPGERETRIRRTLVYLLGFDRDLSREISIDVSPTRTVVVNGFPSYSPKFKDISLITNERLVSDHSVKVQYARANNPFEVYNLLERIRDEDEEDTFMNIAPLGTKPMALGACLFALHNPDVRVVYPMPERYDDSYADEYWTSWRYTLHL